jgi:hypothetical protein
MMLELGVARTTEMSLMALGLSRTSAVAVAEFIMENNLSRKGCVEWLRTHDLEGMELPLLVREEIRRRIPSLRL